MLLFFVLNELEVCNFKIGGGRPLTLNFKCIKIISSRTNNLDVKQNRFSMVHKIICAD